MLEKIAPKWDLIILHAICVHKNLDPLIEICQYSIYHSWIFKKFSMKRIYSILFGSMATGETRLFRRSFSKREELQRKATGFESNPLNAKSRLNWPYFGHRKWQKSSPNEPWQFCLSHIYSVFLKVLNENVTGLWRINYIAFYFHRCKSLIFALYA